MDIKADRKEEIRLCYNVVKTRINMAEKKKYTKIKKALLKKPPVTARDEQLIKLISAAGNGDSQSANILFKATNNAEVSTKLFRNKGHLTLQEVRAAIDLNDKMSVSAYHKPHGSFDGGQISGLNLDYKF